MDKQELIKSLALETFKTKSQIEYEVEVLTSHGLTNEQIYRAIKNPLVSVKELLTIIEN